MKNTIRKPRLYLYMSLPSIFIWLFILIGVSFEAVKDGPLLIIIPILVFAPFVLTFIYLTLLQLNWKIEVNKDNILYQSWLRKKHLFKMNDVVVVHRPNKKGTVKFYLYCNGKKFTTVSMFDTNMELVFEFKNQQIIL